MSFNFLSCKMKTLLIAKALKPQEMFLLVSTASFCNISNFIEWNFSFLLYCLVWEVVKFFDHAEYFNP